MAINNTYTGFSTIGAERTQNWVLTDVDLVKRDIQNHFDTIFGERIGRPTFGCKILLMLEEQLTPTIRDAIRDEAVRIVKSDPRVNLVTISVYAYQNGVRVELTLDFIGMNTIDTMFADFQKREDASSTN